MENENYKRKVGKGDVVTVTYRAANEEAAKDTFQIGDKLDLKRKPFPMYDMAHPWVVAVMDKCEGAEVVLSLPEQNQTKAVIANILEAYIPEPEIIE